MANQKPDLIAYTIVETGGEFTEPFVSNTNQLVPRVWDMAPQGFLASDYQQQHRKTGPARL